MLRYFLKSQKNPTHNSVKLPFGCCWQTSPEHPGPRTATEWRVAGALDLAASIIVSNLSQRLRGGVEYLKNKNALEHWENTNRFAHVSYDIQGGPHMMK